jgi:outer membrane lipoprotein-sorting protein
MRTFPLLVAALSVLCLTGAGQPIPQRLYQAFSAQERANLDRISAYLNSIRTLRSEFVQIGPDGATDQGEVYIEKPGRIHFAFRAPNPVSIVATGGRIYVKNARLNTVDNYDLDDTPLGLLLNEKVDLARNRAVMGVSEQDGALILRARTSTNRSNANITLVFSAPAIELRQWTVKDNQGGTTTVALQDTQTGGSMDQALFAVPVKAVKIKQSSR